jgi:hypothetical protein
LNTIEYGRREQFVVFSASLGDRSSNGGLNRFLARDSSSGRIRRDGTRKFRTDEGNSKPVSLPPHYLTISLRVIA